ncbi:MAG TPA: SUMF1/EgtB/PvdO family nonheme iron enzyme [Candidatus Nanoarchaeia archaeon]|nr:hypothetical protein [uncultured archaeon]AQS29587.1 hypothetical protein [uncultured archaeon]HLD55020.1 SUMF1/EgtB/PvdO family nonheme iron enzyme [Candidatus Nanoarchaeia archaeon]
MINKKRGLLILCMILLLGGLVSAIPQTFSVHGKLENNAGSPLEGTYNMSFNIYNAYTGGSSIWNLSNQNVDTDSNGIYNVVLTSVNLDFGSQYYLGVTVGNDSEMSPRINLSSSPYAFEAQNVSVSGVRFNSNVDFGTNYNFTFDGGTLFVDGSKGYVGIGTITPNATLHIVKPGVSGDNVTIIHSGGGANDLMLIGNSGYPYAVFSEANTNDPGNLQLKYVGVTTISLLANGNTYFNNGNVGIGTTTPQQKLHVNGSILANGTINATTDVCIQGGACLSSAGTGSGTISGSGTSNYVPLWNGTSSINKSNIYQGASGNIGIGTVNPISRLEINSAANGGPAGLNINFATRTNTEDSTSAINVTGTLAKGTVFKVEAGGNVGIGTSSPQQKLDVVGNINSTGFINATTDVCIQGGACLSSVSASAGGWTKTGTQVALTTATDNVSIGSTDFFVDNSKGYVGIGTTAPKKELDIVGNIKVSGYVYSNGCPNDMAYVSSAGGFCIDKWEASRPDATDSSMGSDTSMAISQAGVIPWVSISQIDSRTACNNAGKRLCSDEEWLAAANIQGQVYYLPTNLAVSPYYCVTDSSTYCLGHSYSAGDACNTGNKTGCVSKEGVYDMVGNVWEWTNETVDVIDSGSAEWKYANSSNGWQSSTSGLWNKYGNDGVYFPVTTPGRAVLRGGAWDRGALAGPFCASLGIAPTAAGNSFGFRCCSG